MNKTISLVMVAIATMLLLIVPAMADELILENKDDGWDIMDGDGIYGVLNYEPIAPEFIYTFDGYKLQDTIDYSLIYYADFPGDRFGDWGGNNPGALLGEGTSDTEGYVGISGSVELDMNLPHEDDANFDEHDYSGEPDFYDNAHGAKIWLVPSSDYNAETYTVTAYNPTTYLFETDLITYTVGEIPVEPEVKKDEPKPVRTLASPYLGPNRKESWRGYEVGDTIPTLYTYWLDKNGAKYETSFEHPSPGTYYGGVHVTPPRVMGQTIVPMNDLDENARELRIALWYKNHE